MSAEFKTNVLVVDDDKEIVGAIAALLEREGYNIYKAYDGLMALDMVMSNDIHLMLIDVMMPNMDGLSAIMRIRETKNIPIIVLSAKTEDTDKVVGLSVGADDYMSKPYNPMELVARVKSGLRRYMHFGAFSGNNGNSKVNNEDNEDVVTVGGLELYLKDKKLLVDGEAVKLTATEFKILELLMQNPGRIYSAEEIYVKVWNEEGYGVENTVMVHIRHIREKVEINPKEPRYIKVVWGLGYKLEEGK